MSTIDKESPEDLLVEFLAAEAEKSRRSEKRTWTIGLVVAAVMVAYLTYIGARYKATVINPYHLGPVVASKVDRQAPEIINKTEAFLQAEARPFARRTHQEIMGLIPVMGKAGRARIDLLIELIPTLHGTSKSAVDRFFVLHGDKIKTFYQGHLNAGDDERLVREFVDMVLRAAETQVAIDVFGASAEDMSAEGLEELSVLHLREISEYFDKLAKKPSFRMTRLERLQRRLIVAWVKAFSKPLGLQLGRSS